MFHKFLKYISQSISGMIVADNGQELLIYGKTSILKDAKEIHIRFSDGNTEQASLTNAVQMDLLP